MFLNSPRTVLYSKIQSWQLVQKWFEEVDFEYEEKFRKTYKNLCQLNFRFQFSCSVMSDSLWLHGLQHARPPCPSPTPGVYQTHVHWVSDAIQPPHPLLSPSPPALNLSQHKGLFKWVSCSHQVAKVLEFQLQHHFHFKYALSWYIIRIHFWANLELSQCMWNTILK